MVQKGNNQLGGFQSIGLKLNNNELDILELFAQAEALTIMQITSILKSTKLERTYKNVYKSVQKLKSRKLIEETKSKKKIRNNEKRIRLTDDGIYQLFLKRPYGILVDQLSVKKGQHPISYAGRFLRNYGKNLVFKLFLYPYFEEQTISIDNFNLLQKLFRYVTDCCKRLETAATAREIASLFNPKFSWNKVLGEDNTKLLESLKEIGALEKMNEAKIEKSCDNSNISVRTPQNSILIRLNALANKAVYIKKTRIHEYKITIIGSEITVGTARKLEDPIKSTLDRSRKIIESYIFELVSNLEQDEMKILAHDTKFMLLLEDMNTKFEIGYRRLMELRKMSS